MQSCAGLIPKGEVHQRLQMVQYWVLWLFAGPLQPFDPLQQHSSACGMGDVLQCLRHPVCPDFYWDVLLTFQDAEGEP